jgi:hypothetical protein
MSWGNHDNDLINKKTGYESRKKVQEKKIEKSNSKAKIQKLDGTQLKIDKTTLPKDNEQIAWQTQKDFDNGNWKIGVFVEGDDLFAEGFEEKISKWDVSWDVIQWKPLNIEWDFVMWAEKSVGEAQLKGVDDLGFEYFGTANWVDGEALNGVNDIELILKPKH